MTTPSATTDLNVLTIPVSEVPTPFRSSPYLANLVKQACARTRDLEVLPKGKTYTTSDGGAVVTGSQKSGMSGREAKTGWHFRISTHPPSSGATFDEFRNGLLVDHAVNEKEYITDIRSVKRIHTVEDGLAEVWLGSYKLPIITSDRDFLELLITLDLPAHPKPFSVEHEAAILEALQHPAPSALPTQTDGYRSFLNIQVPVTHPDAPDQPNYVRAAYASAEAIWEKDGKDGSRDVEWRMFVQSDAKGSVPLFLQEMSMCGQIAHDVPAFLKWNKQREGESSGTSSAAVPTSSTAAAGASAHTATASSSAAAPQAASAPVTEAAPVVANAAPGVAENASAPVSAGV